MYTCLSHERYRTAFSDDTRRGHSVYELCFIVSALATGKMAELNHYQEPFAFMVDAGNQYAEHVRLAHGEMERLYPPLDFPLT